MKKQTNSTRHLSQNPTRTKSKKAATYPGYVVSIPQLIYEVGLPDDEKTQVKARENLVFAGIPVQHIGGIYFLDVEDEPYARRVLTLLARNLDVPRVRMNPSYADDDLDDDASDDDQDDEDEEEGGDGQWVL